MIPAKKYSIFFGVCASLLLLLVEQPKPVAQDRPSHFRVNVVLVQLNIAVTDKKGNYIAGLRPEDFVITEDKIPEKIATFEEGASALQKRDGQKSAGPRTFTLDRAGTGNGQAGAALNSSGASTSLVAGANVFILFDTSDYMYRSFVYAQDAITNFVRTMNDADKIAFYSYSRNLSRAAALTSDRFRVVNSVRSSVAGDQAALYNSMLLTVKDAAPLKGRKAIVVFSNGPDNASSVPPEDVAELAQSTGTIIYIISTRAAQEEPVSAAAFERVSRATGGKAYFAKDWRAENQAFASVREDLDHLYTLSYYPQENPNRGWRTIKVKLVGKDLQKYHLRTRDGYRFLQQAALSGEGYSARGLESDSQ